MAGAKGRSGRPKKPQALHIAQGTYRADRHGPEQGPKTGAAARLSKADAKLWAAPEVLTIAARAMWEKLTPPMVDQGRLTLLDYPLWVQLWIEFGRMSACASQQGGGWSQENEAGVEFLKPDYTIHKDARTAFISLAAQFGLSPRTRASVHEPLQPTQSSALSKMGQWQQKHGE